MRNGKPKCVCSPECKSTRNKIKWQKNSDNKNLINRTNRKRSVSDESKVEMNVKYQRKHKRTNITTVIGAHELITIESDKIINNLNTLSRRLNVNNLSSVHSNQRSYNHKSRHEAKKRSNNLAKNSTRFDVHENEFMVILFVFNYYYL